MTAKEKNKFKRKYTDQEKNKNVRSGNIKGSAAKEFWKSKARNHAKRAKILNSKVEEGKLNVDWSDEKQREPLKKIMIQEAISITMSSLMNERSKEPKNWISQTFVKSGFKEYEENLCQPYSSMKALKPSEEKKVEAVFAMEDEKEYVVKGITLGDLKRLQMKAKERQMWLNDTLIDKYFDLICKKFSDIKAFTCFLFNTLIEKGSSELFRRYPRRLADIFEKRLVLFPVLKYCHWSLVAYDVQMKKVYHFDSMGSEPDGKIVLKIKSFISYAAMKFGKSEVIKGLAIKTPLTGKQHNAHDCGVFMAQYARCISKREQTTFAQKDILQKANGVRTDFPKLA